MTEETETTQNESESEIDSETSYRRELSASEAAGQQLLDYLMNDPIQQAALEAFIFRRSEALGVDLQAVVADESKEDTAEYNLYYAETVCWHSSVLAHAIRYLSNVDR